jgi:hypothetical protein
MQFSCFGKDPAGEIKQGKYGMKDEKENIEEFEPHFPGNQ